MSHNPSFLRAPQLPIANHQQLHPHHPSVSRKPSIVEMLSSPPPLPVEHQHNPNDDFSLSRNTSISSRASSILQQTMAGSDWTDVLLADLAESNKLICINSSYSIQRAFETLIAHDLTSLPVAVSKTDYDLSNCLSFDCSDLNTYLLLVMNKINLNELSTSALFEDEGRPLTQEEKQERLLMMISKAKKGEEVPVDFIVRLHPKNPFLKFKEGESLFKAVEAFGNGVHRVAILNNENRITGILSQRRMIKFFWENARRFPSLEFLLSSTLQDLKIGSTHPITIFGDQSLIEALQKMFDERVSSLAVIDRNKFLVGNISIVDVKNVSSTKNSHYLFKPVTTFISYNLSQKGIEKGQDQYPIFHVSKQSSLNRVIAKLVATQSHRLWIVESRNASVISSGAAGSGTAGSPSSAESALPDNSPQDAGRVGKLVGVVTLTDILGLFAQHKSGIKIDPQSARKNRRRSSTSTTRSSFEGPAHSSTANSTAPATPQTAPPVQVQPNLDMFRKSYQSDDGLLAVKSPRQ